MNTISLFIEGSSAQFRKFATLRVHQGKGYGALLLNHVILEATKQGVTEIWCNARIEKANYYSRFELGVKGDPFEKDGKTYVVMSKKISLYNNGKRQIAHTSKMYGLSVKLSLGCTHTFN